MKDAQKLAIEIRQVGPDNADTLLAQTNLADVLPEEHGGHWRLRAALLAGCVLSVALAEWSSDPLGSFYGDLTLARLLRGMAVIKGFGVFAAVIALSWRFGQRVTAVVAVSYCVSVWTMTATTMLIWKLTRIPLDAIVFHTALISLLATAWRDDNSDLRVRLTRRFAGLGRHRRDHP